MSGSCHLDRASNVEIGVECQIFVTIFNWIQVTKEIIFRICTTFRSDFHVSRKNLFWFFSADIKIRKVKFTKDYLFWVKALLQYLEVAPNFKTWLRLKNIMMTIIQNSILNSPFDALSKWHDPHISWWNSLIISWTNIWSAQ